MEDSIYIRLLVIREHLGRITPEEQAILDKYLMESEDARRIKKEIKEIPRAEFMALEEKVDIEEGLANVLSKRKEGTVKRYRPRAILASAVAAALIIWGGISLVNRPDRSIVSESAKTAISGNATLTLANGEVINLNDSGSQRFSAGNASVNNTNRLLKYVPPVEGGDVTEGWNTLTVPAKLDYQVELSDGTIVWLNSTTKFRFPFGFSNRSREVFLEAGEAYFKIAPNADQPFIVHTAQGDVQVLGTEFNINAYAPNQLITSLVNGKVAVIAGIDKQELSPGLEATVEAGKAISVRNFDPSITLSWREGLHYFNDAPITSVALMLERWFDTPLIIDNPTVGQKQFRGRLYRHKPLQTFINQMNLTADITFYWKNGKLHCK